MKKRTLILGLIVAVATTSFFASCNKSNKSSDNTSTTNASATEKNGKIVYVDIDSVFKHYEMAMELNKAMETKQKQLDAELNNKTKTFQSSVLDFQNKVQKGLLMQAKAQEIQQELSGQEQQLYQLRDQYRSQLAEENSVNQRQIYQSIMDYLKEYNKAKGYEYILANTFPSSILYADASLNITKDVIAGINVKFSSEKGKEKETTKKK